MRAKLASLLMNIPISSPEVGHIYYHRSHAFKETDNYRHKYIFIYDIDDEDGELEEGEAPDRSISYFFITSKQRYYKGFLNTSCNINIGGGNKPCFVVPKERSNFPASGEKKQFHDYSFIQYDNADSQNYEEFKKLVKKQKAERRNHVIPDKVVYEILNCAANCNRIDPYTQERIKKSLPKYAPINSQ